MTSANFTEAAHERNIEAGVMLRDKSAAKALSDQFETLAARQILQQLSIEWCSPIRQDLIDRYPLNKERIFSYFGGEKVNSISTQTHDL